MIKLVYAIRRRADFSAIAFQRRWLAHGALVKEVATTIRVRRYTQSHTLSTAVNVQIAAPRGANQPFDGVAELWWDSINDFLAAASIPAGQAAYKRLLADESEFIDFAGSSIFLTEEHVIF